MNWKTHENLVAKLNKISKTIGISKRRKQLLPLHTRIHIYNSLILSHINYVLLIWGYKGKRIFALQKSDKTNNESKV